MTVTVLEKPAPALVEWTECEIKALVLIARRKFNEKRTPLERRMSCSAASRQHDFLLSFTEQIRRSPKGLPWDWADAALEEISALIQADDRSSSASGCPEARKVFLRVMNRALREFYTRRRIPASAISDLLARM